ncbi:putative uncharacterized protein [Clostridium sp. CAG:571]|mgnify:FL=1|jgi:hypothetical protein|nr:putative uncharacterized protein [Clostridium sp. CAG:571]
MKLVEIKEDIESENKTLNKKKVIFSIIILIIIIVLVIVSSLYITNTSFRETMDKYVFRKSITENNLDYIEIDTENSPNIFAYDKYIVTLEKNTLTQYSQSGKKEGSLEIQVSDPIFDAEGKYLVVAEKNKQKIYLIYNDNIVWEKDIEGNISKINVNKNGYTSVIISGTTYKSVIAVYDKEGKELFKTYLSSTVAVDSSISEDNKYMSFGEVNTSGTLIQSSIKTVSIEKAKQTPSDSIINTYDAEQNDLIINIQYQDKNRLICMYNSSIHIIKDGKDEVLVSLNEKDNNITFSDIELSSNAYRIIEKSAGLFKSNSTVEIYNTTSKKQNIYNFNGVAKKVYSYGNIIAIDLGSEVLFINMNGWLIKKYNSAQDIKNIVLTDNLAGIVYRDKIEFINL